MAVILQKEPTYITEEELQKALQKTADTLQSDIRDEMYQVSELSEQQASKMICDLTANYILQRDYIEKIIKYIFTTIINIFIGICSFCIIYLLISKAQQNVKQLISSISIMSAIAILVLSVMQRLASRYIAKIDVKSKLQIIFRIMRCIEGVDDMSERLQNELLERLAPCAGLEKMEDKA